MSGLCPESIGSRAVQTFLRSLWRRCYAVDALALLPDFILVLFLKCVQQAQCRSER